MNTDISTLDGNTRTVTVRFHDGDFEFTRSVNACYDQDGHFDETATAERVAEVARGVAVKRGLGILAPPADVLPEATQPTP